VKLLYRLAKSTWGRMCLQIGLFFLVASATLTTTGLVLGKMGASGILAGMAAKIGAPGAENYCGYLSWVLSIYALVSMLKMLYDWIDRAVTEHFSAVRQVELRTSDIGFIIAALEEYQVREQTEQDNPDYTDQGREHAARQACRADFMIGHLDYYTQ